MFMNECMKSFKELSGEEMEIIVRNFDKVEEYYTNKSSWGEYEYSIIFPNRIYRIPNRLDRFDWSVVAPKWNHLRRDKDGEVYLYITAPTLGNKQWNDVNEYNSIEITGVFSCYKNNGMPWDKMILDRPEGV